MLRNPLIKNVLYKIKVLTIIKSATQSRNFSKTTMQKICFRTAAIQCNVGKNRSENIEHASRLIAQAKSNNAELISLPECFNSPYGTKFFDEYSECIPEGPTSQMLSQAAKEHGIYLIGNINNVIETDKG